MWGRRFSAERSRLTYTMPSLYEIIHIEADFLLMSQSVYLSTTVPDCRVAAMSITL